MTAHIDPKETYFENAKTNPKMLSAISDGKGISAENTPSPVATPLPPLNLKNIVNACPAIAAAATAIE